MQLTIARNKRELAAALGAVKGKSIALVPTMGALHNGHITLMQEAKRHADIVVASIFVNPKQFGPNEDFAKYPRMLESDLKQTDAAGVAIAYTPSVEDMYQDGFSTTVSTGELGKILCGVSRPVHFDGVATVVAKLLLRVMPQVALFGEKDYQQLCVIRRMVRDLDIPVEIIGVPTIREADGLAMSSRNAYLSAEERNIAPLLYKTMNEIAAKLKNGAAVEPVLAESKQSLATAGFKMDYLEVREADSLKAMQGKVTAPSRLFAAAWLGKTRLIDNIAIK